MKRPWRHTVQSFWTLVDKSGECWLWTGYKTEKGYGRLSINGQRIRAHRYAWESINGPVPNGFIVCHRCDTPACVRPDHLFIGTINDNTQDMIAKGRHAFGERAGSARLTAQQVCEILHRYYLDPLVKGSSALAREFGVSPATIWQICTGRHWKHIAANGNGGAEKRA